MSIRMKDRKRQAGAFYPGLSEEDNPAISSYEHFYCCKTKYSMLPLQ